MARWGVHRVRRTDIPNARKFCIRRRHSLFHANRTLRKALSVYVASFHRSDAIPFSGQLLSRNNERKYVDFGKIV